MTRARRPFRKAAWRPRSSSCIYLDKLDKFVEQELIPQYTQGVSRIVNPEYRETANRLRNARRRGDRAESRELGKRLRGLPHAT